MILRLALLFVVGVVIYAFLYIFYVFITAKAKSERFWKCEMLRRFSTLWNSLTGEKWPCMNNCTVLRSEMYFFVFSRIEFVGNWPAISNLLHWRSMKNNLSVGSSFIVGFMFWPSVNESNAQYRTGHKAFSSTWNKMGRKVAPISSHCNPFYNNIVYFTFYNAITVC